MPWHRIEKVLVHNIGRRCGLGRIFIALVGLVDRSEQVNFVVKVHIRFFAREICLLRLHTPLLRFGHAIELVDREKVVVQRGVPRTRSGRHLVFLVIVLCRRYHGVNERGVRHTIHTHHLVALLGLLALRLLLLVVQWLVEDLVGVQITKV